MIASSYTYDEPPKFVGWWMLRFKDAVPDEVDTYPGDVDFPDIDRAKSYAQEKLLIEGLSKCQTTAP
jgi:hypothetical protein